MFQKNFGFWPEPTDYSAHLAGRKVDVRQHISVLPETEVVHMIGGNSDFPDCPDGLDAIRTVEAYNPYTTDRRPVRQCPDFWCELEGILKQETTFWFVEAMIDGLVQALQEAVDRHGAAVEQGQAIRRRIVAGEISSSISLLRVRRLAKQRKNRRIAKKCARCRLALEMK